MTPKLIKAFEAAEALPQDRQDALAEMILDAAERDRIDAAITAGEASYTAEGGRPAAEVFDRLLTKYDT